MQTKALRALNDTMDIQLDAGCNGPVAVEYGPKGADDVAAATGTVVAEVSNTGLAWYPQPITLPDKTIAANMAAAAIGYFEVTSWQLARIRMSVVGGAQGVKVSTHQRVG